MLIDVFSRKLSNPQTLKSYVRRRLGFALDRFTTQITRVHVRLADINGPKGGRDKSCLVQVYFDQMPPILIESLNEDIYQAVGSAAERARRVITSRVGKLRRIQRITVHQELNDAQVIAETKIRASEVERDSGEKIFA